MAPIFNPQNPTKNVLDYIFDGENVSEKHIEMFSKCYKIKPKWDCIYHFSVDLEQQMDSVRLVPNQSDFGWI